MKAMLIAAGLLAAPVPLAAQQPSPFPREHPADAARRDMDRRFRDGQADMDRLRTDTRRDAQRQQDRRTPEGLRPEGLRPLPSPPLGLPGPR